MKRTIVVVSITGIVLGAAIGANLSHYFARQHQRTTAVMALLDFHLQELERALSANECIKVKNEVRELQFLANEIALVLPLADAQDAVFHQHVEHLKDVLDSSAPNTTQCTLTVASASKVRGACDDCHHDYR